MMARWLLMLLWVFPTMAVGQSTLGGLRTLQPAEPRFIARSSGSAEINGRVKIEVSFKLCIAPTGRIACLEPLPNQNPELVNALLDRIPLWRFKAASSDGLPVSAESTLRVSLLARSDAENGFEVEIMGAQLGPRSVKVLKPTYPDRALRDQRSGGVLLTAMVMPDGSLQDISVIEEVSDRVFVGATIQALRHWSFVPEKIDGQPIATKIQIPVAFVLDRESPTLMRWEKQNPEMGDSPIALDSAITLLERPEK